MSTVLYHLCINLVGLTCFVLLLNPLMMLVFHQFVPRFAAKLAHNRFFCGERICRFYTRLALKWPFKWSKWWITIEDLDKLTDEQQKIYYHDVSWSDEVRDALRPRVWAKMLQGNVITLSNRDDFLPALKTRDELFAALLDVAYEAQKEIPLLHSYIRYGTLPKSQMQMLVDRACSKDKNFEFDELMNELCFYIDRCGIRKDLLKKIVDSETLSQSFKDTVKLHNEFYLQKTIASRLYRLSSVEQIDEWSNFCAKTKYICVAAQEEMSLNQYGIFLKYGHHLDAEAIAHLLWYRDCTLAEQIFRNEPKFGILDDKIKFVLKKHDYLQPTLGKVIKETEEDLQSHLDNGEWLSDAQVDRMFDCPSAEKMVYDYITKWTLSDELQPRIFELKNAKDILELYAELEKQSDDYRLTLEVREDAIERGWLLKE